MKSQTTLSSTFATETIPKPTFIFQELLPENNSQNPSFQNSSEKKKNECSVCKKVFSTLGNMRNHYLTIHQDYRPYVCDYPGCNKKYSISSRYQVHRRTHEGKKPFLCQICNKSFNEKGNLKKIRVNHLHLEEDAASMHHSASDGRLEGASISYVDYNRAGMPLGEIVSEPDISSAQEAVEYAMNLQRRVRYAGASDADLDKGMMRFDANVSMKCSDGRWSRKVEVKNMNSFRALERAIEFEIKRQKKILLSGGEVLQETRHWNDAKGVTTASRVKEFYRKFIVEPDLPPLIVNQEWIDKVKSMMPEMPDVKANRYVESFKLPREVAEVLTDDKSLAEYFELCVNSGANPVRAAHWVRTEVLRVMNEKQLKISDFMIKPEVLANLVSRVDEKKLSTTQGKEVFDYMCEKSCGLDDAIKALGITEGGVAGNALNDIIQEIIKANPDVLEEIKSGKDKKGKKLKFLQGLVMKETKGQAKPQEVAAAIAEAVK